MNQSFLLDCDPGIDDAFAILCALQFGDLDVVTTVSGNVSVDCTTRNALYILELAGANVPVHRGADRPLQVPAINADDVHGASGLGTHEPPELSTSAESNDAVQAIIDYTADGDATIVAIGPLTNIAMAIERDPGIIERIDHLYWMGGGTTVGNVTPLAEFNAWCDPHATEAVLDSGIELSMFDLDLTHTVQMGNEAIEKLRGLDTPLGHLLADALGFYARSRPADQTGQPMHDPCAVLGFLRPDLFEFAPAHIVSSTTGAGRGQTIVDRSPESTNDDPKHRIAVNARSSEVTDLILQAVAEQGVES